MDMHPRQFTETVQEDKDFEWLTEETPLKVVLTCEHKAYICTWICVNAFVVATAEHRPHNLFTPKLKADKTRRKQFWKYGTAYTTSCKSVWCSYIFLQ